MIFAQVGVKKPPQHPKCPLSAPPGGADDIVNYEVFGASFYLVYLRVLLVILEPFRAISGPCWGLLKVIQGPFLVTLGLLWGNVGQNWGCLGQALGVLVHLDAIPSDLGAIWGHLAAILGLLKTFLGPY